MKELLKPEEIELFNQAGHFEKLAAQTYEHLANIARMKGLFGCEKFFLAEAKDENKHFQKLAKFLNDMGVRICMPALEEQDEDVETIDEMFEKAYEMELNLLEYYESVEEEVSSRCENIILDMIEVQVKAVGEYGDLIARLSITGDDILVFDQEIGNGL